MLSNFSQIKGPPKRLAKATQSYIRNFWHIFIRAVTDSKSWFEVNILPIWTFLVSVFHFFRTLCGNTTEGIRSDETTPLLEGDTVENTSTHNIRGRVPVKPLELRVNPIMDSPDHGIPKGTFYFSAERYCVLCRKVFHDTECVSPETLRLKWDHQFIAICPVVTKSSKRYIAAELESPHEDEVILKPIGFRKSTTMLIDLHILTWSQKKPFVPPYAHLRQDAYVVHRACRGLAASVFPNDHVHRLITQFGQSTKYLVRTGCCEDKWNGTLQNMKQYISSLDPTSDVTKLMSRLSACPAEIENDIRDYSEHDLLSTIINFYRTTVPLIREMDIIDRQPQYLWFQGSKEIAAETVQIYDAFYLSSLSLHADTDSSPARSSLKIALKSISGIQVGLGDYGIGVQALRFLYLDGTSACIGEAPETSYMTILGTNITGIKYVKDNLKITKVELIAKKSWHLTDRLFSTRGLVRPEFKNYMLPRHSMSTDLPFLDWRRNLQTCPRKRNFNTWQRSLYYSLVSDPGPGPIVSITIYCLKYSVCGIAFEMQPNCVELLGSRNPLACAIHLEFDYNEGLNNILVNADAAIGIEGYPGELRCPSLVITTSFSRNLICAPIFKACDSSQQAKYTQLRDPHDQILRSIFTDGSTNRDGSIRNLGATFKELTEVLTPRPEDPHPKDLSIPTSSLPDQWTSAFISIATINNVRSLTTCRRGDRIIGLRIRYSGYTHTEILGQFDPSSCNIIKTVFEYERDGKLLKVIFRSASKPKIGWGDADCEFVCAVEALGHDTSTTPPGSVSSNAISGREFVVSGEELSKPVIWLFNPTDDYVQFWDGKTRIVEVEASGPRRELMLNPGLKHPEQVHDPNFVLWDQYESDDSDDEDC